MNSEPLSLRRYSGTSFAQRPVPPTTNDIHRVFTQNRQHLQDPTAHRPIRNKITRPNVVPMRRRGGLPSDDTTPDDFALGRRHRQAGGSPLAL